VRLQWTAQSNYRLNVEGRDGADSAGAEREVARIAAGPQGEAAEMIVARAS